MRSKIPVGFLFLTSIVFIGFGDQVLPPEIGRYSFQVRSSIDQWLVNAVPNWQPKTNPYRRTEDAIQDTKQSK
ncbi:hypothetical protein [Leptolyngbya sp. NIES-2104]|uniref:hypothetical protein n=1 Tax=Leptolyngbya sp. NIES-2104 TaxID=1552121 RepID=UPI0006EC7BC9|nr:hypothetical protein [Leptolyngbya sp. NIES-2104]GAP98302.1 hypothetical protein NIES2104_48560 [Leptolyngbya sp. NIES-2104]